VACLIAVAIGHQVDVALGTGEWARNFIWLWMIFYEVSSNTKNLAVMDIAIPESIGNLFERVLEAKGAEAHPVEEKDHAGNL